MKLLFVHQTFPGQYPHVVRYLLEAGHTVVFIAQHRDQEIAGVRILQYLAGPLTPDPNSYVGDLEAGRKNTAEAKAAYEKAAQLAPDHNAKKRVASKLKQLP